MTSKSQGVTRELSEGRPVRACRMIFYVVAALILGAMGSGFFDDKGAPYSQIETYGVYFFLGILGAVIANSTGAGGGIVFLPFFTSLGFSLNQSLATSFGIQCFGMTAGALTWLIYKKEDAPQDAVTGDFRRAFLVAATGSLLGLRGAQEWMPVPAVDVKVLFSVFSIAVGLLILQRTLSSCPRMEKRTEPLGGTELLGLGVVGLIGGAITAWLSVGVGELVAVYLIGLRFRVNHAVALAVCVSSVTVITGLPHYLGSGSIVVGVASFAAVGALIGGTLAKRLAVALGTKRLKVGMALWIIVSSIIYLMV